MRKVTCLFAFLLIAASCSDFLDQLPKGNYTNDNIDEYPTIIRGFVDKAYDMLPSAYSNSEFMMSDCATDDAVSRTPNNNFRRFAKGTATQSNDPFADYWRRDYEAIFYCNMFLHGNRGYNTRYLLDDNNDRLLRNMLQGDAYALRAWYLYDLLKKYGGIGANGQHLGVPIITSPVDPTDIDPLSVVRASYGDCVEQILADCDSACVYLPLANRNSLSESTQVEGAIRYRAFDRVAVTGLKSMVWLTWASPANNPENDLSRWTEAARCAAEVMRFKLDYDGGVLGAFDPFKRFLWSDPNSPEIVFTSTTAQSATIEAMLYPQGFKGTAELGPTQQLVDAFPMANGYPIGHPKSNYDPQNPYANRDPRFYSTIFYNGSQVIRPSNSEVMYTFASYDGGADASGGVQTSETNYYVRKYIYLGWNGADASPSRARRGMFHIRWTGMCLNFAEAANRIGGPFDDRFGFSAYQAMSYIRSRNTNDNNPGVGLGSDPYMSEVAALGRDDFEAFIRNERRIETCFEGQRLYDLRRWYSDPTMLNVPVSRAKITKSSSTLTYGSEVIETLNFASTYLPIPQAEMRKAKNLVQNKGWESWK